MTGLGKKNAYLVGKKKTLETKFSFVAEPNLGQVSLFGGDSCVIPEPARFVRVNLKESLKTSHAKLTLEPAERSCLYPYSLSDSDSLLTYTSNCL